MRSKINKEKINDLKNDNVTAVQNHDDTLAEIDEITNTKVVESINYR